MLYDLLIHIIEGQGMTDDLKDRIRMLHDAGKITDIEYARLMRYEDEQH